MYICSLNLNSNAFCRMHHHSLCEGKNIDTWSMRGLFSTGHAHYAKFIWIRCNKCKFNPLSVTKSHTIVVFNVAIRKRQLILVKCFLDNLNFFLIICNNMRWKSITSHIQRCNNRTHTHLNQYICTHDYAIACNHSNVFISGVWQKSCNNKKLPFYTIVIWMYF